MAEYSSLKVPELKKLLSEKGLAQTGNKADLIARLEQHDQKDAAASEDKPEAVEEKTAGESTVAARAHRNGT
jgi:SAP domain-containing ribonucleoprotein